MFDYAVLKYSDTLELPINKLRCSMVSALSHGLPGGLDDLCEIFKIPTEQAKIKDGKRLIQLFCKPRPKNSKIQRATRETHPDEWARFVEYARNDIEAMRAIHKKLPTWNYPREPELSLWHLDQVINDRGILIDREHAEATLRAVERAKQRLSEQTVDMTEGRLQSTTQVQATIDYIMEEYGIHTDNLTKAGVKKLLELDIPEGLRNLLETRQQAGSSSTAKYQALLNKASSDGRFRGGIQFSGASRTRRAGGRGFQPQNLPSRGLLPKWLVEEGIELMKIDAEDLLFPNTMHLAVSAIRQTLIAPPGMKFCISDLSNIEGRKVAWYAAEEWKLKAFREFDAGTGHDLYKLAYSRAFKIPVENVVKSQRDIGKVMELASGYQGGVGAYVNMAAAYNFDVEKLSDSIFDTLPRAQVDEAYNFLDWTKSQKRSRYGLTDKAFMSVDVLKRLWRNAHPGVTKLWADLQNAAEATIRTKRPHDVGLLQFDMKGNWLRIRLASGRYLCYPYAAYSVDEGITFYGVDQYTRKWSKQRTYSGKILENCIAEDTEVLTDSGWTPIQGITTTHRVWDGEEWVKHSGLKYSGKQRVITVFSVKMTADHLVLTAEGWKRGAEAERYNRVGCRIPNGNGTESLGRAKMALENSVYLRGGKGIRGTGINENEEARRGSVLRVQTEGNYWGTQPKTRNVYASGLRCLSKYGRSLPVAVASCVEKLRRAGHSCLRRVEQFSSILAGYVEHVSPRCYNRASGQCPRLLENKLQMAYAQKAGEQYSEDEALRNADRQYIGKPSGEKVQYRANDFSAQTSIRVDGGGRAENAGETVPVYDVMECGPRNRFVVRGSDGTPLIVHNCCQSSARDVLYDAMPRAEHHGFSIVLHVHDELVAEARKELHVDDLSAIMAAGEPWTEGLPLAAAGHESARYCKE